MPFGNLVPSGTMLPLESRLVACHMSSMLMNW